MKYKAKRPKRLFCKRCCRETMFRFSTSQNVYICEQCQYDKSMAYDRIALLESEEAFMKLLNEMD